MTSPGTLRLVHIPADGDAGWELRPGNLTVGRSLDADVVLDDPRVSRQHARLEVDGDRTRLVDLRSTNGTFVNGDRVANADLVAGDRLSFGGLVLQLLSATAAPTLLAAADGGMTVVETSERDPGATRIVDSGPAGDTGDGFEIVPAELLRGPILDVARLVATGIDVERVECVGVGGGMGTFVWVDVLRNSGLPASAIRVVTTEREPYERYRRLAQNSQIPLHERLRSNSDSCPDNLWGFPGYAPREAWRSLRQGEFRAAAMTLWAIFGESGIAQTYTPRSGDVFDAMAREARRIGWDGMARFGRIRAVRKGSDGRLILIASASDDRTRRHYAVSARFVHLAPGYPAIQLLPDLAEYRDRTGDRRRVVNAYESHSQVYEHVREHGGTVLLRGRGIVASRIIQRLWEERRFNPRINVIHLHRSRLVAGHRYGRSQRAVENEFEFQAFNWPKGCWTGVQRERLERASPQDRKDLLEAWGGTTTADRGDWRRIVREGLADGWFRIEYGNVAGLAQGDDGRVITSIASTEAGAGRLEIHADYVIDCTGLIASPQRSPLLDDLVRTYHLPLNPLGRLHVSNDFEVEGLRHNESRAYAAGAVTLGGPFATVDSFLGLQYAALRAAAAIHRAAPGDVPGLNGLHSLGQWLKWARGVAP